MDDLKLPELIDIPDIPIIPNKEYRRDSIYIDEYTKDAEKLIIKTNITNMLTLMEECDEPIEVKKMSNIVINMIILNSKVLKTMPDFVTNIKNMANSHVQRYDIYVLQKILDNIENDLTKDNIHFRYINENIRKYPQIPAEDKIALEKKIKHMRFSYQVRKARTPFKVGQIVGAKDKEDKWWLSRVLHVHDDMEKSGYWYYIRFEGWGELHDEWIYSESFRVNWFNPRKHFLKK